MPDDVEANELDAEVRRDLLSLSKETAELVARHLVMTGRLIDVEPEQALAHARAAGALAGRVAAVREAVGLAAYAAGEWAETLSELRAARRMSGSAEHLPVMADAERALGRPERALAAHDDPAVASLDQAVRVELVLVVAGARRDLGQQDAAVLLLQGPARATTAKRPWAARLWYGYADALLDAGRTDEAREWFAKVVAVDEEGQTDADERLLALDGVVFDDMDDMDDLDGTADREDGRDAARGAVTGEVDDANGDAGSGRPAAGDGATDEEPDDGASAPLDAAALQELVKDMAPLAAGSARVDDEGRSEAAETDDDMATAPTPVVAAPVVAADAVPAPAATGPGAESAEQPVAMAGREPAVASPFLPPGVLPAVAPTVARPSAVPGVAFVPAPAAAEDGSDDDRTGDDPHGDRDA